MVCSCGEAFGVVKKIVLFIVRLVYFCFGFSFHHVRVLSTKKDNTHRV